MDFFSYLQNSGNKQKKILTESIDSQDNYDNNNQSSPNSYHVLNSNFKRGEMIIIKRYENSKFNVYKGYIAEIKEYKKNSDHAYVILHALNYPSLIKIPIVHFEKLVK
jgi:hypothetical protein